MEGKKLATPFVAYFEDLWEKAAPIENKIREMARKELERRKNQ